MAQRSFQPSKDSAAQRDAASVIGVPSFNDDCAVVVSSCDKYADIWSTFFAAIERFWKNRPKHWYLLSEHRTAVHFPSWVKAVQFPPGLAWSDSVAAGLKHIPQSTFIWMLEDFVLRRPVQPGLLEDAWLYLQRNRADCLRLVKLPPVNPFWKKSAQYEVDRARRKYSLTLQGALWKAEAFRKVLGPGESPWAFELKSGARAAGLTIFAASNDVLPYRGLLTHHIVEKGCWIPHEYVLARLRGLAPAVRLRPMMPFWSYVAYLARVTACRMRDALVARTSHS